MKFFQDNIKSILYLITVIGALIGGYNAIEAWVETRVEEVIEKNNEQHEKELQLRIKKYESIIDSVSGELQFERNRGGVMIDAIISEMDIVTGHDTRAAIEMSNTGDLWSRVILYPGTKKERSVLFPVHYNNKEDRFGYFDFQNHHHWLE